MESTLKDLKERRSIRKYKAEQIKKEELDKILEAGTYAATAMGKQSPKMVVIQDPELISKLSEFNASFFPTKIDTDPFYGAPTVVIVLADSTIPTYVQDGSLVMGNLMNAAHALGIGSCWINRAKEEFETEEGKKLLKEWNISENYAGVGHCILGYPDMENPQPKPRKEDYIIYV